MMIDNERPPQTMTLLNDATTASTKVQFWSRP